MMRKGTFPLLLLCPIWFLAGLLFYAWEGKFGNYTTTTIVLAVISFVSFVLLNIPYFKAVLTGRHLKYGANSAVLVLTILASAVFIELISHGNEKKWDLTENKRFSLAKQTVKILKNLKREVTGYIFMMEADQARPQIEDLFKQYSAESPLFKYEFVDPDSDPETARRLGGSNRMVVFATENGQEKVSNLDEKTITNALVKVTRDRKKKIYWVTGHGEFNPTTDSVDEGAIQARDAMVEANFEVAELMLARVSEVPEDGDILVVASPRTEFFPTELEVLTSYLERGGKVLFLLEPQTSAGVVSWLEDYGIEVGNDIIIDANQLNRMFGGSPLSPIISDFEAVDIADGFQGRGFVLFNTARSVAASDPPPPAKVVRNILKTGAESWAETDFTNLRESKPDAGTDRLGPVHVGAYVEFTSTIQEGKDTIPTARMIVYGDGDLASNKFVGQANNMDLLLNSVAWLAQEEDTINIRPKQAGGSPILITPNENMTILALTAIVWPAIPFLLGITIFAYRRRLQ